MNILAVVAHPDDELLGCGATLKRLADAGHSVYSVVLCAPADARHNRPSIDRLQEVSQKAAKAVGIRDSLHYEFPNIKFNAVPHLDMVQAIEKAILKFRPEWIFTHHAGDLNIDHRICYETTMAAVMLPQRLSHDLPPTMIRRVFLFEILSSTDWAPPTMEAFRPNSFFDVQATLETKIKALEEFEGALKPYPHSRSAENLRNLASLRGGQAGMTLAEAFCLVRDVNV